MEELPIDIENKIEQLPIVDMNESEEFQKVILSETFNDVFDFYKTNYLPDALQNKSEMYQRVSLYLSLTGQGEKFIEDTDQVLYKRPVPSIEEFLSSKFYMGYSNATLYEYWKEQLTQIFKQGSPVRKVIFSGCIGCLTKDTVVSTLNGDKTIEQLLNNFNNEWVLSYNTNNNSWEPDKIIDVFYTGNRDVYEITLDNGETIKCTENHQFLSRKNKWVSIEKGTLVPGLSMMPYYYQTDKKGYIEVKDNKTEKWIKRYKIVSIRYLGKQDVYDITTERNHNFALKAGIVAHNSGKSTVARKAFVYVLYRILCLRYPRAVFGIDNDATIANVIISMSLRQVYDTNLLPFVKLMESMPCFQKVLSQRSFENFNLEDPKCPIPFTLEKSSGTVFFPDNIIITTGSNQGHFTGYNVVNSFCDEINEGQIDQQIAMLNTLDNRFASRFQGSDLVFQSVVSSARSTNSAMGEYIRHLPKNDPAILKLNPMLWTVKPDPNFIGDGTTFPVLVGNGSIPSKIITNPGELKAIEDDTFIEPAGCSLIHVPTIYRSKFELQLDQSIQDIAGITTSDNNMVFRDTSRLEDPQLLPEIYLEANIHDNVNLLENLPLKEMFVQDIKGQWEFRRAPRALRYCHVDLSGGGSDGQCDSGIAIVHKEWKRNEVTGEKETIYVTDLALTVNAKNKIDIHAIQNMLTDLVIERNAPIHTISSDQWNGVIFQQALEASGCFEKVKQVSVDSKLEPYTNAARLIELGHVKVGTCPKLKRELEALILVKNKVTRTTELKDEADAIVGSIYNAQMNYNDVPVYEYETLEEKLARHDKVDYTKYLKDYEEFEELK